LALVDSGQQDFIRGRRENARKGEEDDEADDADQRRIDKMRRDDAGAWQAG